MFALRPLLNELCDVVAALAAAFRALDAEHVELALDVTEDDPTYSWNMIFRNRCPLFGILLQDSRQRLKI
jgi:hypothetical protein